MKKIEIGLDLTNIDIKLITENKKPLVGESSVNLGDIEVGLDLLDNRTGYRIDITKYTLV